MRLAFIVGCLCIILMVVLIGSASIYAHIHSAPSTVLTSTSHGDEADRASSTDANSATTRTTPFAGDHILSNDEVIEQTHKCEAAGLDGQQWGFFDDTDNPRGITEIRCIPRKHEP